MLNNVVFICISRNVHGTKMMDSDQEVTREPFENDGQDEGRSDNGSQVHSEGQNNDSLDDPKLQGDSDHSSSCDSAEDADYAKSFGIDLKSSKIQSAYERLIKSDCFKTTPDAKQRDATQKPVIKTSVTSDCIYHKGTFYQKGDIVAFCDQEDGLVYFAQIKGFLQDQFCEKSAAINWLVPIRPTSREFFDPGAYGIGLEDTQLRKLDCMTFVRHCPHDYYLNRFFHNPNAPSCSDGEQFETNYKKKGIDPAYIWTSMKPCSVPKIGPKDNSST